MTKAVGARATASARAKAEKPTEVKPRRNVSRKTVLIGAGATLVVLADTLLLVLLSRWQDEAETLLAANEATGTALSVLQADLVEQEELIDLLSEQADTTEGRVAELKALEASSIAELYQIRDAVAVLTECYDAELVLLDYLWTTTEQSRGRDREAVVRQTCEAAKAAFSKAKAGLDG
ncbi:MAG: hypothetical protein JW722_02565 [Demequinaceae bacterium]|nr:hypothetical protein [Demequinaceae bacterium]